MLTLLQRKPIYQKKKNYNYFSSVAVFKDEQLKLLNSIADVLHCCRESLFFYCEDCCEENNINFKVDDECYF